ncbi:MAG: hypothetical protein WD767_05620 [Alphaproteobacteria bacterium]
MKKDSYLNIKMKLKDLYCVCMGLCSLFLLTLAFSYGITKGFHHWVTEGIEYQNVNIATAITKYAYGMDLGGMAHREVYDALRAGGVAYYSEFLDPLGVTFPDNLHNPTLINDAFRSAASIEALRSPAVVFKDFKPVEPTDIGMAQYYELAFNLFGLKVQSFYYLYSLILLISVVLFFIRHYGNPLYCSVLAAVVMLHLFMFVYCAEFLPPEHRWGVGTVYSSRFISILGILPALHLVIDILKGSRFQWINAVLFGFQGLLLLWLVTVRGTVMWENLWVIATVAILAGMVVVARVWHGKGGDERTLLHLRRLISWPVGIFVLITIGFGAYKSTSTNAFYRISDESLSYHMVWHSIYAGLSQHPGWHDKYGQYHARDGKLFVGDGAPIFAAEHLLETQYGIQRDYIISDLWGHRYKVTERVIKEAYFQFIKKDPRFFAELVFLHRPSLIYNSIRDNFTRIFSFAPFFIYVGFAVTIASLMFALYRFWSDIRMDYLFLLGGVFLGTLGSIGPVMLTFAVRHAINDQAFMLCLMFLLVFPLGVILIYEGIRCRNIGAIFEILKGEREFGEYRSIVGRTQ